MSNIMRLRESTRAERSEAANEYMPMIAMIVPGKEGTIEHHTSFMVLEQWDERYGGWVNVPIQWEG